MLFQVSREGEIVALGPNLKARGALEDWLTALEENMRKVLCRLTKVALVELEGINFDGGSTFDGHEMLRATNIPHAGSIYTAPPTNRY